jgi:hypothetical protein
MTAMKAYASRGFNAHALDSPGRRRWALMAARVIYGSTRYLWTCERQSKMWFASRANP